MQLREAGPADARAIAELVTGCWREAYAGLVPQEYLDRMDADAREVRWRARLESEPGTVVAIDDDGVVVGVVRRYLSEEPPPVEVKTLYVDARHRGTGVGSRLLRRAVGSEAAHLWVFRDNARAIAFYRRHGFAPDGRELVDPDTGVPEVRLTRPATP